MGRHVVGDDGAGADGAPFAERDPADHIAATECTLHGGVRLDVTREGASDAAAALLAKGVKAVVITLGDKGALYHDARQSVHVPVISAGPVVETTGAGDAFNGGFAVAFSEGKDVVEAVRFGCATAGISVTRAGAKASSRETSS